jgi:hypothetical protein
MAWIESHQQLGSHPKLYRLADILETSTVTAVGHLHFLWWWTLDYAPTGDLSQFTDEEIARAAGWTPSGEQQPDAFAMALSIAGFLDEDRSLHDWYDYAGKLLDRRKADADRKRASRSRGRPVDIRELSPVTVPYRTEPNPTEQVEVHVNGSKILGMLSELQGYIDHTDNVKAERVIRQECMKHEVDSVEVVQGFVDYYPRGQVLHGWKDPVAALVGTIEVQIQKVKNPRPEPQARARSSSVIKERGGGRSSGSFNRY